MYYLEEKKPLKCGSIPRKSCPADQTCIGYKGTKNFVQRGYCQHCKFSNDARHFSMYDNDFCRRI